MGDWVGGNLQEMARLADAFRTNASEVKDLVVELTNVVHGAWWKGPDAEKFRSDWDATHRMALTKLAESLASAEEEIRRQAEGQRRVSEG